MRLSLSVRIAEGFQSKEQAMIDLATLAGLARSAGYQALCMRASQVGIHSRPEEVQGAIRILAENSLGVSMVTGDFEIVYNNEKGPGCLRRIAPYLELAQSLGAPLIRVALKHVDDIQWAQRAADLAGERGVSLAHQCHTLSLFETVDGIEETLQKIGRPNFGLILEPANLEICGQDYGPATIQRLAPWILNVYLQNQRLHPHGRITLNTWVRGPVSFDILEIHQPGGINFQRVFSGLEAIGYDGPVTVHQSAPEGGSPAESATAAARYLAPLIARAPIR